MKRWIALEIQRKKLFLSIDYEQSLLFDEVRQASQKKKKISEEKKIDVCAPRGTLGVRRTHSQSSARRANINMFLTDFFCLVEFPLKEAKKYRAIRFTSPSNIAEFMS